MLQAEEQPVFEWSLIERKERYFPNTVTASNFSKAIFFYWTAAVLYNVSCERGAATKCHKNIIYSLLLYVRTCLKNQERIEGYKVLFLMETVMQHFFISLHRQKEHIHLAELNHIQWTESMEMYETTDKEMLSNTPDMEEIIFSLSDHETGTMAKQSYQLGERRVEPSKRKNPDRTVARKVLPKPAHDGASSVSDHVQQYPTVETENQIQSQPALHDAPADRQDRLETQQTYNKRITRVHPERESRDSGRCPYVNGNV